MRWTGTPVRLYPRHGAGRALTSLVSNAAVCLAPRCSESGVSQCLLGGSGRPPIPGSCFLLASQSEPRVLLVPVWNSEGRPKEVAAKGGGGCESGGLRRGCERPLLSGRSDTQSSPGLSRAAGGPSPTLRGGRSGTNHSAVCGDCALAAQLHPQLGNKNLEWEALALPLKGSASGGLVGGGCQESLRVRETMRKKDGGAQRSTDGLGAVRAE